MDFKKTEISDYTHSPPSIGFCCCCCCLVMPNSSQPHGQQHARLLCPPLSPRVFSNSCPLNQWCHHPSPPLLPISPPALSLSQLQGLFQWVSFLHQVAKVLEHQLQHQSFQYSGLMSFRIDWFDLLTASRFKSINSSVVSFLYGPTLASIYDCWRNHGFDHMDLCWQSDGSVL